MKRSWAVLLALVSWAGSATALPQGSSCTLPGECDSGFCIDGFCCESQCTPGCATCAQAEGSSANGVCGPVAQGTLGDCFPYKCDGTSTACPTSCLSGGCAPMYVCNAANSKCVGSNGAPCVSTGDCLSGFCEDGFCCGSECGGCHACSLALTGRQNGVCAVVLPETDPHDVCPQGAGFPESCLSDGMCNSRGICNAFAPASTLCAPAACNGTTVIQPACDGAGVCYTQEFPCAPGVCSGDSCLVGCTTDQDCSPTEGYCGIDGICAQKGLPGASCASNVACKSGNCTDSICCQTGCDTGARCEGGVAYTASHCDGLGECIPGSPTPCGAYACGETACKQSCASQTDCVAGAACIDEKCVAQASCDGDHTLTTPQGEQTDCSPFKCAAAGICYPSCTSSLQCVEGHVCNSSERCVRAPEIPEPSSCGCRLAPARRSPWELFAFLGFLVVACRRRFGIGCALALLPGVAKADRVEALVGPGASLYTTTAIDLAGQVGAEGYGSGNDASPAALGFELRAGVLLPIPVEIDTSWVLAIGGLSLARVEERYFGDTADLGSALTAGVDLSPRFAPLMTPDLRLLLGPAIGLKRMAVASPLGSARIDSVSVGLDVGVRWHVSTISRILDGHLEIVTHARRELPFHVRVAQGPNGGLLSGSGGDEPIYGFGWSVSWLFAFHQR